MSHTSQTVAAYATQVHTVEVQAHASSQLAGNAAPRGPQGGASPPSHVEEFLRYLAAYRKASPLTVDAYRRDLARLEGFLQASGRTLSPEVLEPRTLQAFAVLLSGYAPATINRALNAISSFCSFLARTGRLERNPVDNLLKPKKQRKLPDIPSLDDCRALIAAAATPREKALLLMMMAAGLRRAEVLDLRLADVSADLHQVTVRGKGDKQRLVFLPDEAATALADYLSTRTAASEWLFVNKAGQRVGNTSFARMFRRIKRKAGLGSRDLTPHRLRHFYATRLLHSAVDVRTVQTLLGHASLSSTEIYLHTDDNSKKAAAAALPSFVASPAGEGETA